MHLEGKLLYQHTYEVLKELFDELPRVCLMTSEGSVVYLKYEMLGDVGTLPQGCEVAHRYLQLNDKDIVITNDPFSGGTTLSSPTLIMGVASKPGKAEFLIASRLTLMPQAGPHKTIDDEGLRIPPSPLVVKGQLNSAIFEALKSHPLVTEFFVKAVEEKITRLLKLRDQFVKIIAHGRLDLSKAALKNYLKGTADLLRARLEDLPYGETIVEDEYSGKDVIKLRLEINDGNVLFDYSGTAVGEKIFMTDSAAYGASVLGFLSRFHEEIPLNSGSLSLFHITAPRGSLVNATFPRSVQLGHTDGLNAITSIVLEALSRIDKKHPVARSGLTYLMYELDFGKGSVYLDAQGFGSGAQNQRKGLSGAHFWRRFKKFYSVEENEKMFPIEVVSASLRTNSGGDGTFRGGDGAAKSVRVLKDATLRWQYLSPVRKPEGVHGGKSGLPAEMILQKANGEKIELGSEGVLPIQAGDMLISLAPGGGGYGLPESK